MPDLFAALGNSNSETLAMQLALLENVNASNALRPSLQKAWNRATQGINKTAALFNKSPILEEHKVVELKDRVRDGFAANVGSAPGQILTKIKTECRARLQSPATDSDTSISVKLIDAAAAHFKIDEWLTPAEKAEAVSQRYQEESLANLRKMLGSMSPSERSEVEKKISEDLASLPHEQREAMQRDLKLDRLSGQALVAALLAAGGPLAGIVTLSSAGFGVYLALTTIIHAVATTALGITLPFAFYTSAASALSILTGPVGWAIAGMAIILSLHFTEKKIAGAVFAGVVATASRCGAAPSSFPSPSLPLDPTQLDKAAATADALQQKKRDAEADTIASRKKLAVESGRLEASEAARKEALRKAETARTKLAYAPALGDRERAHLRASIADAEEMALAEMEKCEELRAVITAMASEKELLESALEQARRHQSSFEDGEARRVLELWAIHFPKMTFERQPARWVVHKRHRERISLERKLAELHSSADPAALSRGKMAGSGDHHLKFRLETVECRMFYRVRGGQIIITQLGTNQQAHSRG